MTSKLILECLRELLLDVNGTNIPKRKLLVELIDEELNPTIQQLTACDMSNLDEMDAEEDARNNCHSEGCNCGFELESGKKGCGKVIDEEVYRDDDGEITDTKWIHCGEEEELCDECIEKQDAVYGVGEK